MSPDVLRLIVATLALLVAGATTLTAVRYVAAAWRLGRSPGRILARHVAEVAAGTAGLVTGYALAILDQLENTVSLIGATGRLWIYLVSMILLLVGVIEVGTYQRTRANAYPQRQAQVLAAVRTAMEGRPVSGPSSADRVAVLVTNAVLDLEGTTRLPELEPARDPQASTVSATDYGRHAVRTKRGPTR